MKKLLIIIGIFATSENIFASGFFNRDSVGIERVDGKSFIIHQVEDKETLFGISRRYKTPVNEIVQSNPILKDGLKLGQRIKIPFLEKAEIPKGSKLHNVAAGETLYTIARNNQVSVQDLMKWNDLLGTDLSVGQSLVIENAIEVNQSSPSEELVEVVEEKVLIKNVPAATESRSQAKKEEKPAPAPKPSTDSGSNTTVSTTGSWLTHTVEQGQTLFNISQKFDVKVEDLISWNNLGSNNLSVGQRLKVGREKNVNVMVSNPNPSVPARVETRTESKQIGNTENRDINSTNTESSTTEFKNIKQVGQAEVIEGTGNHKKYLVLHRTAPVGTIMRIRNEQNDITVFARVVGVLPDTGDNSKLIIKVSKAAFEQLRAVNTRFPVEISY